MLWTMPLNACAVSYPLAALSPNVAPPQFLSRPELFKQIHLHTDIRLALGWSGVFIAGATAFYSYRLEFEQSKPVIWIGLIVCVFLGTRSTCCSCSIAMLYSRYIVLTLSQALYAYFIEGDTIFVGKRKTFDKRVSVGIRLRPVTALLTSHHRLSQNG